jgi:hypothetical protein
MADFEKDLWQILVKTVIRFCCWCEYMTRDAIELYDSKGIFVIGESLYQYNSLRDDSLRDVLLLIGGHKITSAIFSAANF